MLWKNLVKILNQKMLKIVNNYTLQKKKAALSIGQPFFIFVILKAYIQDV